VIWRSVTIWCWPGLFDALDALLRCDFPVTHAAADRGHGHGRISTRASQVLDAPGDLPFPHVSGVYLFEHTSPLSTAGPCQRPPRSSSSARPRTRAGPGIFAGLAPTGPFTILGLTS
jgi:hypothetical protein